MLPVTKKKRKRTREDREWGEFLKGKNKKKSELMPKDGFKPQKYRAYAKGGFLYEMMNASVMSISIWYLKNIYFIPNWAVAITIAAYYFLYGIGEAFAIYCHKRDINPLPRKLGTRFSWYAIGSVFLLICVICVWCHPPGINKVDNQGFFYNTRDQLWWYTFWTSASGLGVGITRASHRHSLSHMTLYYGTRDTLAHHNDIWEKTCVLFTLCINCVLWTFANN